MYVFVISEFVIARFYCIRRQFKEDILSWIQKKLKIQEDWSAVLQTLEGHLSVVSLAAFLPDGNVKPALFVANY